MESQKTKDDVTGLIIVTTAVTILLVQLGRMVVAGGVFSEALFVDSDVYMWLNRAEALAQGRGWFDHVETRINPPEGHVQHWTRPVDFMLLAGGKVLSPFFGFRDGLALWANIVSPLLFLPAIWVMYRLSRLLLPRREAVLSAAVFALHPMVLLSYSWGRADHHALLRLGLVIFLFAFLKFFLEEEGRRKWAFIAGWVGAWTMWANIEALGFVLMGLAVLGLWWLMGRRELLVAQVSMALGLFGGITTAVLIERGPEFFQFFPIDTIGFPYVVVFGLNLVFWAGLAAWSQLAGERGGIAGRAGISVGLAGLVLGVIAVSYPVFFAGPFGEVDELYRQVRLQYLGEQLPALMWGIIPPLGSVGRGLALFGIILVGIFGFYEKIVGGDEGTRYRWAWGMLGFMAVLYTILALDTVRWSAYLPAVAAPAFALVGGRLLDAAQKRRSKFGGLLRPLAVGGLLLGFATVGLGLTAVAQIGAAEEVELPVEGGELPADLGMEDCDLRPAARVLAESAEIADGSLIMVDPDRGSEVIYRTDHTVLAIANHRYQPGFTLHYEVMSSTDWEEAHRRLVDRDVAAVMVCRAEMWPALRRGGQALIEALARGQEPDGFELAGGPRGAGGWWIYEVVTARGTSSSESDESSISEP